MLSQSVNIVFYTIVSCIYAIYTHITSYNDLVIFRPYEQTQTTFPPFLDEILWLLCAQKMLRLVL